MYYVLEKIKMAMVSP